MKMKRIYYLICVFLFSGSAPINAQIKSDTLLETITTVKNSTSETFYFGFAQGDQVWFSFKEVNGATIKDIEFNEYSSGQIYSQSNVGVITDKLMNIAHTGIYYFSLRQSGFLAGRRSCYLLILRKPATEGLRNFNTTVYWETKTDTVFYTEKEKYLIRRDTIVSQLSDQLVKLGKKGKNDRAAIVFSLPDSTFCWAWWIASGKSPQNTYLQFQSKIASMQPIVQKHGLLAHIAMGGGAGFSSYATDPVIQFAFISEKQQKDFQSVGIPDSLFKSSNMCFGALTDSTKGLRILAICNPNKRKTSVAIRICAIRFYETWGVHDVKKFRLESKQIPYLKN